MFAKAVIMGDSHDFTHSAGEGDDFLLSSQESNCSAHFMHDESLLDQNEIDTKVRRLDTLLVRLDIGLLVPKFFKEIHIRTVSKNVIC